MRRAAPLLLLLLLLPALPSRAGEGIAWPDLSGQPGQAVGGGGADAALVVAISEYHKMPWIPGAKANGQDWVLWLKESRGIQLSRVHALYDGSATVDAISREALAAAEDVGPEGTLWVVFIGHGAPAPRQGGAALLGVATPRTESGWSDPTYVLGRDDFLADMEAALPAGARLVAVLDTCFSGQAATGAELLEEPVQGSYRADTPERTGRRTLFLATSDQQFAGLLPGRERPAFSYLLLGALRGWADDEGVSGDGDGTVSAEEAISYAETALRFALGDTRQQIPTLVGDEGALVLPAREAGPALVQAREPTPAPTPVVGSGTDWGRRAREAQEREEQARLAEEQAERLRHEAEQEQLRMTREAIAARQAQRRQEYRDYIEPLMRDDARDDSVEVVAAWAEEAGHDRAPVPGYAPVSVPAIDHVGQARRWLEGRRQTTPAAPGGVQVANRGRGWRESEVVEVPAGEFLYGCRSLPGRDETKCDSDELSPAVRRSTGRFWIDRTEVTVDRYLSCVADGSCGKASYRTAGDNTFCNTSAGGAAGRSGHPMNCVGWSGADAFCRAVGGRLPTEEEWEKAARGTDGRVWAWGDSEATCSYAVMNDGSGGGCGTETTAAVGTRPAGASPYGALDMSGNVWEWTSSCWERPDKAGTKDPGSSDDCTRSVRGGSFDAGARLVRAGNRVVYVPADRDNGLGFRCARSSGP